MWSTYGILTIAVRQRLLKIVFYNNFILGDFYHVSMGNFKAIWSYVHIMHKETIFGLGLGQKAAMLVIN